MGPIIINRITLVGKQCIVNNHEDYSSRHVIDLNEVNVVAWAKTDACFVWKVDQGIH